MSRLVAARAIEPILLLKAHVRGYLKQGKWIPDYDTKAPSAKAPAPAHGGAFKGEDKVPPMFAPKAPQKVVGAQFGGMTVGAAQAKYGPSASGGHGGQQFLFSGPPKPKPKPKAFHPQPGEKGEKVGIYEPHTATGPETWAHGDQVAIVTPGGELPPQLNGVPFSAWTDAPKDEEAWDEVEGQNEIDEPEFDPPEHLDCAAGLVIEEPDGRVWVVAPTNGFGGSPYVCPKGRSEGMGLQATAIKEAFEEMGLKAEITGFLGDFARTMTFTRYYTAKRTGGTPAAMGWESQAAVLVPREKLHEFLTGKANAALLDNLTPGRPG